ncbi:MAG: tRNA adenosine(34) deaminase TadA [candidate division KSB1 bacterium]|nr:tRNA adenosine(34) deaminase TadA [candidate division KSB1 bacterium]MDZ7339355.1 tRNA adenosine(34) deaminase TadA [candidate division KSB1 bacterium]MDZ7377740.1 tRNA adenosine(34) deaminase TadA [candidate division KSB1 bacterium]MDZ7384793.1 tRNA adenosine(34) deaminase TadA [candidate division KSB1 bacterium]MDZ7392373.1 tRNA adenosine(34) deaminase TadA [candidate division KSB1 bacterium]
MSSHGDHENWMEQAFREAEKALAKGEVPVGAVVVYEGRVIGRGHNLVETLQDPTAHAEMLALTAAANALASWRLNDAVLYVTLEPCPMCMGALLLARISSLVYGATDPRYGACGSVLDLAACKELNTGLNVVGGVLAERSSALLRDFFASMRKRAPAESKN